MGWLSPTHLRGLAEEHLSPEDLERVRGLILSAGPQGYDALGAHPSWVGLGLLMMRPLYDRWFRVDSAGHEHLPESGGAILAGNHSGALPFDALMLWTDVLLKAPSPRLLRIAMDNFVGALPFINTLFSRAGGVGGSRSNLDYLLGQGELCAAFPEGVPGIVKPFTQKYKLRSWRTGHVEFALAHRVPIVPVGIVGAEEQMPILADVPLPRVLPLKTLPIPLTPLPLPVKYRIRYGAPLMLHEMLGEGSVHDPERLQAGANLVRDAVQVLIDQGLSERAGWFA